MPSPWTELRAAADPITRQFGFYTAYRLARGEYIGEREYTPSVLGSLTQMRAYLRDRGYEPNYLSAAKRHPTERDRYHDLSYRRVPDLHPGEIDGTTLAAIFNPSECQYHVHAFKFRGGRIELYSHYEARPDILEPSFRIRRLRTHYRPTVGDTYFRGVTDLNLD